MSSLRVSAQALVDEKNICTGLIHRRTPCRCCHALSTSLRRYGSRLMDLRSCASDDDHVVTVFQVMGPTFQTRYCLPLKCPRVSRISLNWLSFSFTQCNGRWGCLSVSNHSSLRYRNPVYRSLRELAISYFDDYMNGEGQRTLRSYSEPMDLIGEVSEYVYASSISCPSSCNLQSCAVSPILHVSSFLNLLL